MTLDTAEKLLHRLGAPGVSPAENVVAFARTLEAFRSLRPAFVVAKGAAAYLVLPEGARAVQLDAEVRMPFQTITRVASLLYGVLTCNYLRGSHLLVPVGSVRLAPGDAGPIP